MPRPQLKKGEPDRLSCEALQSFDDIFGVHPGFRPVHAKGVLLSGTFTPFWRSRVAHQRASRHSAVDSHRASLFRFRRHSQRAGLRSRRRQPPTAALFAFTSPTMCTPISSATR
jgi:hypothetical protein